MHPAPGRLSSQCLLRYTEVAAKLPRCGGLTLRGEDHPASRDRAHPSRDVIMALWALGVHVIHLTSIHAFDVPLPPFDPV